MLPPPFFFSMLRLPRSVLEGLLRKARLAAPEECCGLLAGRVEGSAHAVERALPVRNASPRPRVEYLLDPEEQLRALLRVEDELGLCVVGFYHSHPAGPAQHSSLDEARASWPGASYLLVHLAPEEGVRSARCDARTGRLLDEPVIVA